MQGKKTREKRSTVVERGWRMCGIWMERLTDRLNERPPLDCDVVDEERVTGGVTFQAEADLGHRSANANGSGCLEVDAAVGVRSSGGLCPHC
jgi:hypothetical protein